MLKLLRKLGPYIPWVLLMVGFIVVQNVADLFLPDFMADVIELAGTGNDAEMLSTGMKALGVAVGALGCGVCIMLISSKIAAAFGRNLRKEVFDKIQSFVVSCFV